MIQRLSRHPVVLGKSVRRVLRVRKHATALAEHLRVEIDQRLLQADIFVAVREIAVLGTAQLICGAVLMDDPRHLIWMADEVRRELRADDEIDGLAVALAEIDQPPYRGVREISSSGTT